MTDASTSSHKFRVPGQVPGEVERPHLTRLLNGFNVLPCTTVIAPIGYGKTVAVAAWARRQTQIVWYALDVSDNDLSLFSQRFTDLIERHRYPTGAEASKSQISAGALSEGIPPVTIVFDHVHLITRPEIWRFVADIVYREWPAMRTVLIGQSPPVIALDDLRLQGLLGEIGIADLSMHDDEAEWFLSQTVDQDFDPAVINNVIAEADGWIAGVSMALFSREGRTTADVRDLNRPFTTLLDRMSSGWSESFDLFVSCIALPDRICGELIAALDLEWLKGKDPDRVLRDLPGAGLFLLPLTEEPGWYRFQVHFREELLQHVWRLLSPEQVQSTLYRAACWHRDRDEVDTAIVYLLRADHMDDARELIRKAAPVALALDQWHDVSQWLRQLGAANVDSDVELLICRAWIAQIEGRQDAARSVVDRARVLLDSHSAVNPGERQVEWESELALIEALASTPDDESETRADAYERAFLQLAGTGTLGEMLAIQFHLVYLSQRDPAEARRVCDQVIRTNSDQEDRVSRFRLLWARIARVFAYGPVAEMHQLLDMSWAVLSLASSLGARRQTALGHFLVGSGLYELDRIDEAEEHFRCAWTMPEAGIRVWVGGATRLARVLDAQGRKREADELLRDCAERLLHGQATDFIRYVRTTQLRLLFSRNDLAGALQLVWALEETDHHYSATEVENVMFAKALVLSASNLSEHRAMSDSILSDMLDHPEWIHWQGNRVQLAVLNACRSWRLGDQDAASEILKDAISQAERGGYRRVVVDLGPEIEVLLRWFHRQHPHWTYLAEIMQRFDRHEPDQSVPETTTNLRTIPHDNSAVALLSRREIDVLELLCQRYTDKEIAEHLSISPTTVKSHTRSIYRKLEVNSRRQVMRRVMEASSKS